GRARRRADPARRPWQAERARAKRARPKRSRAAPSRKEFAGDPSTSAQCYHLSVLGMSTYSLEDPIEPQPSPERAFGRYRLAYQLASGGMGTVYLARAAGPAGFEKLVALKRIHPHMATDRRFVSMFLDEARIAAQIQHPNVCSVIDFGEVD